MTDLDVLVFIRDVMLANKHVDAATVWSAFNLTERSGDMKALFYRWAVALNNPNEQYMIEHVISDLVKQYES